MNGQFEQEPKWVAPCRRGLDCGSPLPLSQGPAGLSKSGRGLRQSKPWRQGEWFLKGSCSFLMAAMLVGRAVAVPPRAKSVSGKIPDRPEKLKFPPLVYEPPLPTDYRVQLKNGVVAYLAPDRELPLVNVAVYVRTGDFVEPAGKEGVTDLTGYLLARGGTQSRSAEELEERLAFLAANLGSQIGETQGSVSL